MYGLFAVLYSGGARFEELYKGKYFPTPFASDNLFLKVFF